MSGSKKLTKEQKKQQEMAERLTIQPQTRQFAPVMGGGLAGADLEAREEHMLRSDASIERIKASMRTQDTLADRLKTLSDEAAGTSWLKSRTIPAEKEMRREMDNATKTFQIAALSGSQKTKRGKQFKKKAQQQAKMINLMRLCNWQREEALEDLLQHGKTARLGLDVSGTPEGYHDDESDSFLERLGDDQDLDTISVELKDLSFYYEQTRSAGVTSAHYKPLELIAEPATRKEGYELVLQELLKLDLSIFDYKNNEKFIGGEGERSFVKRYAALRAFGKAEKMIDAVGRDALGKDYLPLVARARVVSDILQDYENRALLLQSPYYVLLAGKDFDSLTDDDIRERIGKTSDILAKNYMERILERRARKGYKKGSNAKELMKKQLEDLPEEMRLKEEAAKEFRMKSFFSEAAVLRTDAEMLCAASNASAAITGNARRLASMRFRKEHNLSSKKDNDYRDYVAICKADKIQPLAYQEWLTEEIKAYEKKTAGADTLRQQKIRESDEYFYSLSDSGAVFRNLLGEAIKAEIDRQITNKTFRKDKDGEERRAHMKKYAEKDNFADALAESDVDNLLDNLVAGQMLTTDKLDMSMFSEEMMLWISAYPVFDHCREIVLSGFSTEKNLIKTKITDIEILLEENEDNPAVLAEWSPKLKELKEQHKPISLRTSLQGECLLKIKNKQTTLLRFWEANLRLNAIDRARVILAKETPGVYRDRMLMKLLLRETALRAQAQENWDAFYIPVNGYVKEEDPFTPAQIRLMRSLDDINEQIDELKKQGPAGKETACALLEKARQLFSDYDDPEYAEFLKLSERYDKKQAEEEESDRKVKEMLKREAAAKKAQNGGE